MKKILTAGVIFCSSLLLADAKSDEAIIEKIQALPMAKAHKFVTQEIKDGGSLIFAKGYFDTPRGKQQAMMYVSQDFKTAVYGRGFDTNTGKEYTSFSIEELKSKAGMVYGSGKTEYFLVVDPLCPVCMTFDKTLPKYEKEMKMYVLFMPLLSLHPEASKAIAQIISQDTQEAKHAEMQKISNGNKDYLQIKEIEPSIQAQIDTQTALAQELGARGTPTLYTASGRQVDRGILEYMHNKAIAKKQAAVKNITAVILAKE